MWRSWPPWSQPWAARSTPASQLPFAASSRTPCATSAPRPAVRWSQSLPGEPPPSARGVCVYCGTTPPLSDCGAATPGRTARTADSPRTGTMPPLSASAPGASAPSQLSTRIPTPGIWRSANPRTLRWHAAGAAGPAWDRRQNHTPTRVPLRRRVLSPPAVVAVSGQRPKGGAPPGPCHLGTRPGHQCATLPDPTPAPSQVGATRPGLPPQRPCHRGRPS